jgi:hypothetical protein
MARSISFGMNGRPNAHVAAPVVMAANTRGTRQSERHGDGAGPRLEWQLGCSAK